DLKGDPDKFLSEHHRRNVRKALRTVVVTHCETPASFADEWSQLYMQLIRRHASRGIPALSERALREQLGVPGLEMFHASVGGRTAGIVLWLLQNEIAYYHLGAYNEAGYRERASFALFRTALNFFAARNIRWLSLGAGA